MMRLGLSPRALHIIGVIIATASTIVPALRLGPLFQQPPFPLAVLWAAYGWASEDENGMRAPIYLALLGLLHDLMAGGPIGLFITLYCAAYLVARAAAVMMSAPNLFSHWGGFAFTALVSAALAAALAGWMLGGFGHAREYAVAAAITVALFPLVRPLYMEAAPSLRRHVGMRA